MQWSGTVLHRHDLNQGLREAIGSFERETIIFILRTSSEAQRGSVTSPQPHSTEGQSRLPHRLARTRLLPCLPQTLGVLWVWGRPGLCLPVPSSGVAVAAAKEGAEDPSRFLPSTICPHPLPPQLSNKQGGKTLRIQLEFISILILEPHFQQIIKLLFNYKQNMCAFPLSGRGPAWRGEE